MRRRTFWRTGLIGAGLVACAGCWGRGVILPAGYLPPPPAAIDAASTGALAATAVAPRTDPADRPTGASEKLSEPRKAPDQPKPDAAKTGPAAFELPPNLPGADAPLIAAPRFDRNTSLAQRDQAIRAAYPDLKPVSAEVPAGREWTLAELQQTALANSPVVRRAAFDVDAAYGATVQAGLPPNPTAGYQADQVQPGNKPSDNAGQQGAFINQLVKTAHKLSLAQTVTGFDWLNAQVALRRAEVDVRTQVRSAYFTVLVARKSVEVSAALAGLADEVYRLQLKQLAAGEAAGYEPLQLFAQAVQARNGLAQAEATARAAWKQLTAALNQPDLPVSALAGQADALAPALDRDVLRSIMLDGHTDVLTAQNTILQAQTNIALQQRIPIPDIATNVVVQHDNSSGNNQFGVQVGLPLPLFDRNQGNIRQAKAKLARAHEDLAAIRNDLTGRLAEALGRYEANLRIAENYRDRILPNLARAYRGLVRRYQVETEKVSFNDVVVAQQNYAQALQAYLAALDGQWKAVVDVAALTQTDELYPEMGAGGCR